MELLYATRDGQSRRIAERIAKGLAAHAIPALPRDLASAFPALSRVAAARLVVVVAAVRYGKPLPEAEQFLASYRTLREPPQLVLLSVNLTARKPGRDTVEGNAYLRKSIARHGLAPALALAIAGRLDYSRYGWLDRQVIRCIMKLTGGPTDLKTCIDYTPWDVVDDVAVRIAALHGQSHAAVAAGSLNFNPIDLSQGPRGRQWLERTRLRSGGACPRAIGGAGNL
jgi:menaquinone-dependent protoporphyrinogen oxidase